MTHCSFPVPSACHVHLCNGLASSLKRSLIPPRDLSSVPQRLSFGRTLCKNNWVVLNSVIFGMTAQTAGVKNNLKFSVKRSLCIEKSYVLIEAPLSTKNEPEYILFLCCHVDQLCRVTSGRPQCSCVLYEATWHFQSEILKLG